MIFKSKKQFASFLEFFPTIDPPFTLTPESRVEFNRSNQPFSDQAIKEIVLPLEDIKESDDLTEFEPCLKFEGDDYIAIIYFKASIFNYDYVISTFDKKTMQVISRKTIGGIRFDNEKNIGQSVAHVSEDHIISVMVGNLVEDQMVDGDQNKAMNFEILPTGDILFDMEEGQISK